MDGPSRKGGWEGITGLDGLEDPPSPLGSGKGEGSDGARGSIYPSPAACIDLGKMIVWFEKSRVVSWEYSLSNVVSCTTSAGISSSSSTTIFLKFSSPLTSVSSCWFNSIFWPVTGTIPAAQLVNAVGIRSEVAGETLVVEVKVGLEGEEILDDQDVCRSGD